MDKIMSIFKKKEENGDQKEKKEEIGNEEKNFLFRKHCIGSPTNLMIRGIVVSALLTWNLVAFLRHYGEGNSDSSNISDTPVLYDDLVNHKPLFKVHYGDLTDLPCNTCRPLDTYFDDSYKLKVKDLVEYQGKFLQQFSVSAGLILGNQVINVAAALIFIYYFGTKTSQMYLSTLSVFTAGDLNSQQMSYHMLHYTDTQPEQSRQKAYQSLLFWNLAAPLGILISLLWFIIAYYVQCSKEGSPDAEIEKITELVQAVLNETGKTELYLFGQELIKSIHHLNTSITSCSAGSILKFLFSNVLRIISVAQIAYGVYSCIERIYYLTYGKNSYVSHHSREEIDSVEYLVAVPNKQPEERIRFSLTPSPSSPLEKVNEYKDEEPRNAFCKSVMIPMNPIQKSNNDFPEQSEDLNESVVQQKQTSQQQQQSDSVQKNKRQQAQQRDEENQRKNVEKIQLDARGKDPRNNPITLMFSDYTKKVNVQQNQSRINRIQNHQD